MSLIYSHSVYRQRASGFEEADTEGGGGNTIPKRKYALVAYGSAFGYLSPLCAIVAFNYKLSNTLA